MMAVIRSIKANEIPLLVDFLYEAIFQEEGTTKVPRTILQEPEIWAYIDDFGSRKGDFCLVAEVDGRVVGAAWTRCIKGFGYMRDGEPEFAISLYPEFRGQGIGTSLMRSIFDILLANGYHSATLSVQRRNRAAQFYLRLGFEIVEEHDEEVIMRKIL